MVPVSTVHSILRNRIYTGWFEWNGKTIQGRHEPLISVELWERVQAVMDGRFAKNTVGDHDITDLVDELNDAMASVFDGRQCLRMTAVDTGSDTYAVTV
jgi:hypothetical protein